MLQIGGDGGGPIEVTGADTGLDHVRLPLAESGVREPDELDDLATLRQLHERGFRLPSNQVEEAERGRGQAEIMVAPTESRKANDSSP